MTEAFTQHYLCFEHQGQDQKFCHRFICMLFLPARRYASAGLCDSDVSVCLSVWTSVCHTPVLCLAERKQDREMYTI